MIRLARTIFTIAASACAATASAEVSLTWSTIDGGGGTSTSGSYALSGTIGQPDASTVTLQGGAYTIVGGFWANTANPVNTCPADIVDIGPSANIVNVDDLLAVINSWGGCPSPCPPACDADIAGSNCMVNVDDLLMIINEWGACPAE